MDRETKPPRTEDRKDAAEGRSDDPPPDPRHEDDAGPTDHRFRDWALI
jgi:hypothetical protein